MPSSVDYEKLGLLAKAIEAELKSIGVWSSAQSLPEEKIENMGAFGINTLSFVEWIQFVLLPILQDIIKEKRKLPADSAIGVHATREFDGAIEYARLRELLTHLDDMANGKTYVTWFDHGQEISGELLLSENLLPDVLRDLANVLPNFEGDFLEVQLQTFDAFLPSLPEKARWQMMDLLNEAASKTVNKTTKLRLRKAVAALQYGKPICKPTITK